MARTKVMAGTPALRKELEELLPKKPTDWNLKDSGARQDFGTGSVRDTREGKGRYDLLPPTAIKLVALQFEKGCLKYGERNWEKGQPLSRYLDSAVRHIFNELDGLVDENHAVAAAWNLLCYLETKHRIEAGRLPKDLDDMPAKKVTP